MTSLLAIVTAPSDILRHRSCEVDIVDKSIKQLMDDMLVTMYHNNGIGLAAVQVGVLKRIIVIDLQDTAREEEEKYNYPLFLVNPEIIISTQEQVVAVEGCLSLPGQAVELPRASEIKVKYLDYANNSQILLATGWMARVIQHEYDHLEGKLLVDYLSKLKRDTALRRLKKIKGGVEL